MPRYIVVWRRSATARFLDVQLSSDPAGRDELPPIAVMEGEPDNMPLIADEDELVAYVGGNEIEPRAVEADLAHRVLGWTIPTPK